MKYKQIEALVWIVLSAVALTAWFITKDTEMWIAFWALIILANINSNSNK